MRIRILCLLSILFPPHRLYLSITLSHFLPLSYLLLLLSRAKRSRGCGKVLDSSLRACSQRIKDKVERNVVTTYNEVADALVAEVLVKDSKQNEKVGRERELERSL